MDRQAPTNVRAMQFAAAYLQYDSYENGRYPPKRQEMSAISYLKPQPLQAVV